MISNLAACLRLLLVTDDRLVQGRDLIDLCTAAERGGVTAIQLRLKQAAPRAMAVLVRRLKTTISIPVLVNDRLDVALAAGGDGVHLGPEDLPVSLARLAIPPGFMVGTSVGTEAEVLQGAEANYWGIGPYNATNTKADAGNALGSDGLSRLIRRANPDQICVAIGGIEPEDVPAILRTGARGVAVVSGILRHRDVEAAARRYSQALQS